MQRRGNDQANLERNAYFCPVYKYPKRNDRYLIFRCYLKCDQPNQPKGSAKDNDKENVIVKQWKLKGVALLCTKI